MQSTGGDQRLFSRQAPLSSVSKRGYCFDRLAEPPQKAQRALLVLSPLSACSCRCCFSGRGGAVFPFIPRHHLTSTSQVMPRATVAAPTWSQRKKEIRELSDKFSEQRAKWLHYAQFFHMEDLRYLKFLIPEGSRILELGCGTGHVLAGLNPSYGVGVDFNERIIKQAQKTYPALNFICGDIEDASLINSLQGPFDV